MMSDVEQERVVSVHITLPPSVSARPGSLLRARVLDVSRADAAATVVGEVDRPLTGGESELDVEIPVPAGLVDSTCQYSVFVHIDGNGSGQVETGDLLSPAAHPVLTRGATDETDVPLITV